MTKNRNFYILGTLLLVCVAIIFSIPAIKQDLSYHNFADQRALLNIPNFFDSMSNIFYIIVAIAGFIALIKYKNDSNRFVNKLELVHFIVAFIGIGLVGFGSGYYHLDPNNSTLVWDRLPMTIAFCAVFSIIIGERINLKLSIYLLPFLLGIGLFSIYYWNYTENLGRGDLRLYALVQFFPIVAIPVIIYLFKAKYTGTKYIAEMVFWYVVAKILEHFDHAIFSLTYDLISGHSLKHIASAFATYALVRYIKYRRC